MVVTRDVQPTRRYAGDLFQQCLFALSHPGFVHDLQVVELEEVQNTMDDEVSDLVLEPVALLDRLALSLRNGCSDLADVRPTS